MRREEKKVWCDLLFCSGWVPSSPPSFSSLHSIHPFFCTRSSYPLVSSSLSAFIIVFHYRFVCFPWIVVCKCSFLLLFFSFSSVSPICHPNDRGWLRLRGVFILYMCVCRRRCANSPSLPDRLMSSLGSRLSRALSFPSYLWLLEMMSSLSPAFQRLHLIWRILSNSCLFFSLCCHDCHCLCDARPSLSSV